MDITCVDGRTNVILSLPFYFKKETDRGKLENV